MANNIVLIKSYHGGLGDALQFSTLPEEFYKQQGRETYLLDGASFRNKEIYDLVWGCNPYIKGVMDGEWNAGDLPEFDVRNNTGNWISNWEYIHGLKPVNTRPKIYYKPKFIDGLNDCVIVDLSSITLKHDGSEYDTDQLNRSYLEFKNKNSDKRFISVNFNKGLVGDINQYSPECDSTIGIESIYHYCDIMYSAHSIFCLHSGAVVLAAAIQRYNKDLSINCAVYPTLYSQIMGWVNNTTKMGAFYYDYVNYIVT